MLCTISLSSKKILHKNIFVILVVAPFNPFIFLMEKSDGFFFLLFLFPPKKTNQQNMADYIINSRLSLFYRYKNDITPCYFLKKYDTHIIGMKSFSWKYSDGLN